MWDAIPFTRHVTTTRKYLKSIADRIEHGANIDDQDHLSGNVPLHFADSFGHMLILELLIENHASIDFKALDGVTALTYAVNNKQKEMAELLIEKGIIMKSLYFCLFKMVLF